MNSNYIITSDGNFISEDELYHWGIKGMKWGVRRYQNSDGSLTSAGRKRYSNPDGTLNEKGKKYYAQQEARLKKERQAIMAQKRLDAKLSKLDEQRKANEDLRNDTKKKTSDDAQQQKQVEGERISDISTEELIKRNNRMVQEANYKQNMEKLGFVVTDGRPKSEIDYKIEELKKQKELLSLQKDIRDLTPKKVSAGKKLVESLVDKVIIPAAAEYGKKYVGQLISDQAAAAAKKLADDVVKEKAKQDAKQAKKDAKAEAKQAKKNAREAAKAEARQTKNDADSKKQAEYDKEQFDKYNKSYSDPTYGGANTSGSYRSSGGERTTVDSNRSYGMTTYKPSVGYYDSGKADQYKSDNAKTVTGNVEGRGNSSTKKSWFGGSSSEASSNSSSNKVVWDSDSVSRGSDGVYRYNDSSTTSLSTTRNTASGSSYVNRYSNVPIAGLLPAPKDDD